MGPPPYMWNGYRWKCQLWHAESSPGELMTKMQNKSKGVKKGSRELL